MNTDAVKYDIQDSVLPFPKGVADRVKYVIWRVIYPFHNVVRDLLLVTGIVHHTGRQNYVLGMLAPGKSVEDFLKFIEVRGYGNHFVAWKDDGQIISLRKLDGFEHQYHLRVFEDGEVRGHYEYTPESHFIWHLKDHGMRANTEEFIALLGDWIVTPR